MRRLLVLLAALLVASCACAPALAGSRSMMGLGRFAAAAGGAVPVLAWYTLDQVPNGNTSFNTSKAGNTITSGDLLVILTGIIDSSPTSHSMTCPSGFTGFAWAPDYDSGFNSGLNHLGCWKKAGVGESGTYTVNWTTANGFYTTWVMLDITGSNASPIDDTGLTRNGSTSNTTSIVAPTVTSTGANRLHISCGTVGGSSNAIYAGYPAGYTQAVDASFLTVLKVACATKTVGSGATGTTTWTATTASAGAGISILVKP